MHGETEILILGLLVAVPALSVLARLIGVPYPIVFVVCALPIGYIPGVPDVELDPDLVLVIFLPPLLYVASFFANLRELRADARAISMASIGLVILTTCVVAVAAHMLIDGLPWAAAFALGAIVSPTDPVAATSIARRLGAPRRQVDDPRGREPHQRRQRAHPLPGRGGRRRRRHLLPSRRLGRVRHLGRRAASRSASWPAC